MESKIYLAEEVHKKKQKPDADEFYFPVTVVDYNDKERPGRITHEQIRKIINQGRN